MYCSFIILCIISRKSGTLCGTPCIRAWHEEKRKVRVLLQTCTEHFDSLSNLLIYSKTPIYRGVWGKGNSRGISGFAVNRGFTVLVFLNEFCYLLYNLALNNVATIVLTSDDNV